MRSRGGRPGACSRPLCSATIRMETEWADFPIWLLLAVPLRDPARRGAPRRPAGPRASRGALRGQETSRPGASPSRSRACAARVSPWCRRTIVLGDEVGGQHDRDLGARWSSALSPRDSPPARIRAGGRCSPASRSAARCSPSRTGRPTGIGPDQRPRPVRWPRESSSSSPRGSRARLRIRHSHLFVAVGDRRAAHGRDASGRWGRSTRTSSSSADVGEGPEIGGDGWELIIIAVSLGALGLRGAGGGARAPPTPGSPGLSPLSRSPPGARCGAGRSCSRWSPPPGSPTGWRRDATAPPAEARSRRGGTPPPPGETQPPR